uniref:Uncharacterized protein n=1 Tax=Arundo donax TaxID=35708 RepID=A0A0A9HJ48_ARUDO
MTTRRPSQFGLINLENVGGVVAVDDSQRGLADMNPQGLSQPQSQGSRVGEQQPNRRPHRASSHGGCAWRPSLQRLRRHAGSEDVATSLIHLDQLLHFIVFNAGASHEERADQAADGCRVAARTGGATTRLE